MTTTTARFGIFAAEKLFVNYSACGKAALIFKRLETKKFRRVMPVLAFEWSGSGITPRFHSLN